MANHRSFGPSSLTTSATVNQTGAADEELFIRSFEDVPRITVSSPNELINILTEINNTLQDQSQDWEKRVATLKKLRSLVSNGIAQQFSNEFLANLKGVPLETSLNDLRSKVVNEACITIAYISQTFTLKVDRFIEKLLHTVFKQIQNSAKFISTSAIVCIRFIIQFVHSSRLVPIICFHINDKSKAIRKAVCEFLDQLLHTWPVGPLEKHQLILQETIKKGIADADSEARVFARRAFWGYADHFRDQADHVMHQLDSNKQKLLYGEMGGSLSASNSTNSLSHFLPGGMNGVSTSNSGPRSLNYQHVPSSGYYYGGGATTNGNSSRMSQRQNVSHRVGTNSGKSVSASNSIENLYRPWSNRLSNMPNVPGVARSIINNQIALRNHLSNGNSGFNNSNPVSGSRIAYGRQSISGRSVSASNSIENLCRPWSSMSGTGANGTNGPSYRSTRLSSLQLSGGKSRIPVYSPSKSTESSPKQDSELTLKKDLELANKQDLLSNNTLTPSPPRPNLTSAIGTSKSSTASSTPSTPRALQPLKATSANLTMPMALSSLTLTSSSSSSFTSNLNVTPNKPDLQLKNNCIDGQDSHQDEQQPQSDTVDHSLNLLSPVINELPFNALAIKMLTKLVEEQPSITVTQLLPKVMPQLVEAYDSPDISVRKAAVFAMVAIHNSVGLDVLSPFLTNLSGSKMKLLKLYISRSRSNKLSNENI